MESPGRLLLGALPLLLAAAVSGAEPRQPDAKPPPPAREEVVIAGEVFKLLLAADPVARARGLMDRAQIDEHGGMLFVHRDVRRRTYWMKNCLVDIDLLYLDSKGRIVQRYKMKKEPPRGADETEWAYEWRLKRYTSRRPAQFVIELKAGSIDRLKLERGQIIELDCARLRKMAR
jgi:uncharacterized membrane protein (UPF0127 family)